MARILQSLVLSRDGILAPQFSSIEEYLERNTQDYYGALAEVGAGSWHPERDAHGWVRLTLTAHFRQAQRLLRRVRQTERLWALLEPKVDKSGRFYVATPRLLALAQAAWEQERGQEQLDPFEAAQLSLFGGG